VERGNLKIVLQNIKGGLGEEEAIFFEIDDDIDIVMLTETWLHDAEELPPIPGFEVSFDATRPRNGAAAGYGGVAIYFRQDLFRKISIWKRRIKDDVIWIRCQQTELAPVQFFCCCYAAPKQCAGCPASIDKWFNTLENEISEARGLGEVLIAGDFNARIGAAPDFNRLDAAGTSMGSGVDRRIMENELTSMCTPRSSLNPCVMPRGRILLDLCDATGLRVVNGRMSGDIPAAVTSLGNPKHNGTTSKKKQKDSQSVIDLFLACPRVFQKIQSLKVAGKLTPKTDHLAATLSINGFSEVEEEEAGASDDEVDPDAISAFDAGHEFIIDPQLLPDFIENVAVAAPLLEQICAAARTAAESKNAEMLNKAVAEYIKVISDACLASGMKIKEVKTDKDRWAKKVNRPPPSIREQRKILRRAHRKSVKECDREAIAFRRRNLRRLADQDRKLRRAIGVRGLERLIKEDPKEFYKHYKKPPSLTLASTSDLSDHFEGLLGAEAPDLPVPPILPGTVPPAENIERLQQAPFSMEELSPALKKVKNRASMLGILKPKLLKASVAQIGPALVELLNASVAVRQLPRVWALSAIIPIPKPGSNTRTCDGYRGIAVGTLAAKLYGSMLDIRMSGWAEASGLRAAGQFGFRKGKGTASASFIMRTLLDQVRAEKGGQLYTCFVDFKKAYDSVPRHLLWVKLERRGVSGWVLDAIKAMYADVPMCVKSATGLGWTFQSNLGVKQGCPLSPLLFGLYLDDWDDELKEAFADLNNESTKFDFPKLAGKDLRSLMYADDLMQAATSMSGLRKQMALLEDFSARWGLTINASKTKMMVFSRIQSKRGEEEAVLCVGGEVVEVVEKFKYLGTIFHCSQLLSRHAVPARAFSGRKAFHMSRRRMAEMQLNGAEINFRIFDVMVDSVLGYGAEIWAPELLCNDPLSNDCERVHLCALKWLLGVRKSTASCIVLAETGRWPLALRWIKRVAKFYNGLVKAEASSILKHAFTANCQLIADPGENSSPFAAKQSWAAQVQQAFSQFRVEISLEEPTELNVNVVCSRWKSWYLNRVRNESGTKICKYVRVVRNGLPESEYCASSCLQLRGFRKRQRLTQLVTGSHWLMEEVGRWSRLEKELRVCKQCAIKEIKTVETVEHMIFHCPSYDDIRADFSCLDFTMTNLYQFLQQPSTQLGSFAEKCWHRHRELNPLPQR
jgi:Reverse transcriptase (RNA-dependent DNA polymerase)/Endonuclease/Exonuclease/phosphatase family